MPTVYRSKVDVWLFVVLAFAALASLYSAGQTMLSNTPGAILIASLVAAVGFGLPAWLLLSTRYTLEASRLLAQSGPFKWVVPLADIKSITPSNNPLSSPALSLDRLRIDYGKGRMLLISPRDKERFLSDIEAARRAAS
ncbi:PH domain-containing protein [Herminiimonas glaciei]|uniref:PH domain-containing protein n=1 Tax=Herminiimonas glaciei TaxID=523788 RepID=A0ABW2IEK8_9BURK